MRAAAQRLVWIFGLFCLAFGVAGVVAFSPVTIALSVTGWFLARASIRRLNEQGDILAPSPHLQYWARNTLFRAVGLMAAGALIAAVCVAFDISLHLSIHAQALLTVLLICTMVVVSRIVIPGFFAASWEVHGARERRKRERSSTIVSRALVRVVAIMIVVTSLVGSFSLLQSLRLQNVNRIVAMARDVSRGAPVILEGIFSPTQTTTR